MTKLAILSDIHGNLPALEAVAADFAQSEVDHVVIAGDLINLGPFSAVVVDRVPDSNSSVIRGHHEYYLLDYQTPRAPTSWNDPLRWSLVRHSHQQLGGCRVLSPGSMGNPLVGIFTASYLLLETSTEGWQAQLRRIAYDRALLLREFERQDFVEDCGVIGCLAIEEFKTARPEISYGVTGFRCPQLRCHLCVFSCDDDPH